MGYPFVDPMDVLRQYNAIGNDYVAHKKKHFEFKVDKPTKFMLDNVGNVRSKRVADIGCGAGDDIKRYENLGATVYGVEPSKLMAERARANVRWGELITLGKASRTTLLDEAVDVATARFSLQYEKSLEAAYKEIARILAPQGRLVAVVPHPLDDLARQKTPKYGHQEIVAVPLFDGAVTVHYWTHTLTHWFGASFQEHFTLERVLEGDTADAKRTEETKHVPEWMGFVARART